MMAAQLMMSQQLRGRPLTAILATTGGRSRSISPTRLASIGTPSLDSRRVQQAGARAPWPRVSNTVSRSARKSVKHAVPRWRGWGPQRQARRRTKCSLRALLVPSSGPWDRTRRPPRGTCCRPRTAWPTTWLGQHRLLRGLGDRVARRQSCSALDTTPSAEAKKCPAFGPSTSSLSGIGRANCSAA